jgi:hypothetical protein
MKKSLLLSVSIAAILIAKGMYFGTKILTKPVVEPVSRIEERTTTSPAAEPAPPEPETDTPKDATASASAAEHRVPFILQAPGAKWDDPIFQDGCEEASVLMAIGWVHDTESVTAAKAANDITALADFEVKRFGYHQDISLPEIVSMLREYFQYDRALLLEDVTLSDIRQELSDGNIVLAPAFGQALRNPNFTSPGPITHMLVLKGYDERTKEFIVNDPGTRRGESYRYKEGILFESLWAYPPGPTHPPIPSISKRQKSIIVIRPSE